VTGSHDKSIRIWEKTDEPLFLEEERERELEAMYDRNLAEDANRASGAGGDNLDENAEGADPSADGGAGTVEAVSKQTAETLMAGERIIEALEVADAERQVVQEWEEDKAKLRAEGKDDAADALPRPPMHKELAARGDLEPQEYVLQVLKKVPAAQMEDALLVLPFGLVCSLLGYVDEWAKQVSKTIKQRPEATFSKEIGR
jgi:U3 small nucleolar RNA-associated protein 12